LAVTSLPSTLANASSTSSPEPWVLPLQANSPAGQLWTGLGLWISHEIVTKHHGTIHARSRAAQDGAPSGTVFQFFIPDDAELLCAGTLARAKADGAAIAILIVGQGDKGQPSPPIPRLGVMRRREMAAAARLLGAEAIFGKVPDGHLADAPAQRRIVLEAYRRFRPTLVLAHNPNDYHADHRAASALAEAASWFCASLGHKTRSLALETQPALWWMDTVNMVGCEPGDFAAVEAALAPMARVVIHAGSSGAARGVPDFHPGRALDPHLHSLERQARTLCLRGGPFRQNVDLAGLSPADGGFRFPRPC